MSATIKYNGSTIASVEDGKSVELDTQGKLMAGNVTVEAAGGGGLKYEIGTFTLATDVLDYYNPGISHNLGVAPKVVVVWTEDYSVASPPSADLNFGFMYLVDIVDCQQQFSSTGFGNYPLYSTWWMNNVPRVGVQNVTSPTYAPQQKPTASVFYLPRRANNQYWRAGVTYSYFISEAWWS